MNHHLAVVGILVAVCVIAPTVVVAAPVPAQDLPGDVTRPRPPSTQDEEGSHSLLHHRVRRQNGEVVESIFQVPIQTLQAVSKVFTTSIQSVQRMREQFFQATRPGGSSSLTSSSSSSAFNGFQQQQPYRPTKPYKPSRPSSSGTYSSALASSYAAIKPNQYYALYNNYNQGRADGQSHAAKVAGVSTHSDGSGFRI